MTCRLPLFSAALLAFSLTAAHAEELMTVSTTVVYGDLDLGRPSDAQTLAVRLNEAAKAVCTKANPETLIPAQMQSCIDAAVTMAMERIESSLDSHVHDSLSGVRTALETH